MSRNPARNQLFTEGADDAHVVFHLAQKHGISRDDPEFFQELARPGDGIDLLLRSIPNALKDGYPRVGLIFDANGNPAQRWNRVIQELERPEFAMQGLPAAPPKGGWIGGSSRFPVRVGLWMMPDNLNPGKLEDFLIPLIPPCALYTHVVGATQQALAQGAKFSPANLPKAQMRAWLAWQEDPGPPYGRALAKGYLSHSQPLCIEFIDWFRRLYGF